MDVDRLLAQEEAGWRALREALGAVPPERYEEPSVTPDGWSVKDLEFHVGAWLAECATQLERMRMGTYSNPDMGDAATDEMNRAWLEVSRGLDATAVRAEAHAARTRMLHEWQELDEVTPDAWEWIEESGPIHYATHLAELQAWLAGDA